MAAESPFFIVPAGKKRIDRPIADWSAYENCHTFVYGMPYNCQDPIEYVAITLNPAIQFREGQAATIYARTTKGPRNDNEYFLGSLGPEKLSSFMKTRERMRDVDGVLFYINLRPKSEADVRIKENKTFPNSARPFLELN
ncbi:hypothetical protein BGZ63DRAFT_468455 [Mariannaea sp. PMI_226]|nr:hypothetical protein BGZ63DRAFT_468455 [Mariannaea sp. PMI_226]